MDHVTIRELIAGSVLGGLEIPERDVVDQHLGSCPECRALERQLSAVALELVFYAEPREAPAGLRAGVLGSLTDAGAPTTPWRANEPRRGRIRFPALPSPRRVATRLSWAPAALSFVLAAALLAISAGFLGLRSELDTTRTLLAAATAQEGTQSAAMRLVADPAHASAWLEPSGPGFDRAVLIVFRPGSDQAFLVASGLPATPEGRVYQFWHADEGGVHPGLTFDAEAGEVVLIPIPLDLSQAQAAMLTLEPDGGAVGEPGPDVVFGELPSS